MKTETQSAISSLSLALSTLRQAGINDGPAYDAMRDRLTQALDTEADEANREMYLEENEDLFNGLFARREQLRWASRCGGDQEWMQEQRMEAMMLGEWDWDSQTPNW